MAIKIIVTSVYSKLVITEFVFSDQMKLCLDTIDKRMTLQDPNAKFTEKFNSFNKFGNRQWDGAVKFFNPKSLTFLTGHLFFITEILDKLQIPYEIDYRYSKPGGPIAPVYLLKDKQHSANIEMRPYQRECIDLVVAGNNHGIFAQSTNSGKTLEAIAISESLRCKTLFMVDRVELLDQTFKKFKRYGTQTVGIINPQNFEPRMITIGMQQTIYSHLKNKMTREETLEYLNTVQLLFVDECHKISSTTGRYCLRHIVNAYYRYGLSGTPLTEDLIRNMYLIGYLGRILQKVSNKDLIDNGYSADPIVNIVSYPTTRISTLSEYSAVYTEGIVKNEERNKAIVEIIKQYKSKSILVVVRHLEHGRLIEKELEETGYFVSGQDTKSDRLWIYNKFSDKKIPIVIASMIYKEGIDIDAIDVLIYAAGEKAPITILQVIGRGLRKRIDKDVLIFYDFEDKGHYYLQRHTTQRKKIYHKEGWKLIRYDKEKYKCNHLEAVA